MQYIKGCCKPRCISSLRDIKMRVLILSALLAFASGAPSAPLIAAVPLIPASIPTIPSGDLQAAAIDAKVQAEDQARSLQDQAILAADRARYAADQARDLAEQAVENQNEKIEEVNSLVKEKNEELFWNVEDKKWQAVDALKTAEAKLDGAVASSADVLAKSFTGVVLPNFVNPVLPYTAPIVYAPGLPLKAFNVDNALLKAAELKGPLLKATEEKKEETKPEKIEGAKLEGLSLAPAVLGAPWVQAPLAYVQPGLFAAPLPQYQPLLTPALVKTQW